MVRNLVAVTLLTALGCSSSTTNQGAGGAGGSAGSGGSGDANTGGATGCADGDAICKVDSTGCCTCRAQQCAAEAKACLCNEDCVATLMCAASCDGGILCIDKCRDDNDAGIGAFNPLRACAATKCTTFCQ